MKRILLVFVFATVACWLNAQKIYFIYLQTENGDPFFVRINDKLYNSASPGYLIIPRLIDSTYNFKLGFPGKDRDFDFTTKINKRDHGYLIKNFGDKGWGLFDLQSLNVQMPSSLSTSLIHFDSGGGSSVNAFTDMLSKAADDPTLKQSPVFAKDETNKHEAIEAVVKEEKKPEVVPDNSDSNKSENKQLQAKQTQEDKVQINEKPKVKTEEVYKRSVVKKISGITSADGFESIFTDQYSNGKTDTIRILIPGNDNKSVVSTEKKPAAQNETRKFLDFSSDTTRIVNNSKPDNEKKTLAAKQAENNQTGSPAMKKNECKTIAENDDFLKLRRKMAGETNDEGMIQEAKKYYRNKCFTTEQVRHLSSMFLSNAGRYNFFDASYNHVSDIENFSSLQSELNDEVYINRFKALLLRK
jgi:hypothetical protein